MADLHLDAARPGVTALALRFLERARGVDSLWILGDLFEVWLGDDTVEMVHEPVVAALAALSASGTSVHLMHGNRDFLLGETFAERVGARLHRDDALVLEIDGEPHLLLHGDTLCTGDVDYQKLRAMLRDPAWQGDFLACTPDKRRQTAEALRERSRSAVASKAGGIMDVDTDAVAQAFAQSGCRTLIHGHTHRPADHRDPTGGTRRLVVGDWHDDHARYVRHDGAALALEIWR